MAANDNTHRETSSLYEATEGTSASGKENVKFSELTNNPVRTSVKHSDFTVDKITGVTTNKTTLKRGQVATITVGFQNQRPGFRDEIKYVPSNFTWSVDSSKLKIIGPGITERLFVNSVSVSNGGYAIDYTAVDWTDTSDNFAYIQTSPDGGAWTTVVGTNNSNITVAISPGRRTVVSVPAKTLASAGTYIRLVSRKGEESTTKNRNGGVAPRRTYVEGERPAYKIQVKNVYAGCGGDLSDATVTCVFKDKFNNNLTAAQGYNTPHTVNIKVGGVDVTNNLAGISNGNTSTTRAWDNGVVNDYPTNLTGKNFIGDARVPAFNLPNYWRGRKASDGRELTAFQREDHEEIVLQSTLGFSSTELKDEITGVTYTWEKLVNGSWVAVANSSSQNTFVAKRTGPGGVNLGSFECYTVSGSPNSRLHIQSVAGTGTYRHKVKVQSNAAGVGSCEFISNTVDVEIYETLDEFELSGPAYVCEGAPSNVTYKVVSNHDTVGHNVLYELFRVKSKDAAMTLVDSKQSNTGSVDLQAPGDLGDDEYYIARASITDNISGVSMKSGQTWSKATVSVPNDWKKGTFVWNEMWSNMYTVIRRKLYNPAKPLVVILSRTGPGREVITFTVEADDYGAQREYHVYDELKYRVRAKLADGTMTTVKDWTTVTDSGKTTVTVTCPLGSTVYIEGQIQVTGEMSGISSTQTNSVCTGGTGGGETATIDCANTAMMGPGADGVPRGVDGDQDFLVFEERGLADESRADAALSDIDSIIITERTRNVKNTGHKFTVRHSGSAINSAVTLTVDTDEVFVGVINGASSKTFTVNDDTVPWYIDTLAELGWTTPSGNKMVPRVVRRRIN